MGRRHQRDLSPPRIVPADPLEELDVIRHRNMPDVPSISNLWDTASRRGFDYLATYKSYVSYGAEGFYPGDPVSGAFGALMTKGDLATPIWFNEFTAGGGATYQSQAYVNTTNTAYVPDYWKFDAMLSYKVTPKSTIQLNVYNINNANYYAQYYAGHAVPASGRWASLSYRYRW